MISHFAPLAWGAEAEAAPNSAGLVLTEVPREMIDIRAVTQEAKGGIYTLQGAAEIQTSEVLIQADEIIYDENTGEALATGNVRYRHLISGEKLEASRVEYNIISETGKFYEVRGQAAGNIDPRPGLLITNNLFSFEGEWAERTQDRYILHHGFLTNCRLPKPIWKLRGPKFDIIPQDRALVYKSTFSVRGIPLLYAPVFYKSLAERPRKSGFLTPNIGTSSSRGYMFGLGYYWAINRSYDLMYRSQYFTQRGFAHTMDFRGKPTQNSDFDVFIYGVNDRGRVLNNGTLLDASGMLLTVTGHSELGKGFRARGEVNYLSSFLFRREFTESFNEAVFSEVHSVAFVTRNWSSYGFNVVFRQVDNFQSATEDDVIQIRHLPAVNFNIRDREVNRKVLPVRVSLDSSLGFLRRDQPLFQTRRFVERVDVAPRVMTAFRWKDINLIPALSFRGTHYDSSWKEGEISGDGIFRGTGEFNLDLSLPSLGRVYNGPKWLGEKVKHVIETEAGFRHVAGIDRFDRFILFDETDLLSNTTEIDVSFTNRLYAKRGGTVHEVLSWQLMQRRYLDPDFGGAVVPGQRNVLLTSLDLTGYAFLDGPRNYSPIISHIRLSPQPGFGFGWRADYDPLRSRFTNSGITADARFGKYFISLGHNQVRSSPVLTANANQFRGLFAIGQPGKKGWNAAFSAIYDFRESTMQFATTQVSYNTGCCGISFQYRRISIGIRNENQFRAAFVIANIGSFGTLRRQERIF